MRRSPRIVFEWALGILTVLGAFGAAERGEVLGLVQDESGAVLVSATVTLMDENTGIRRMARTDEEGVYDLAGLPSGLYKVTVRKPG